MASGGHAGFRWPSGGSVGLLVALSLRNLLVFLSFDVQGHRVSDARSFMYLESYLISFMVLTALYLSNTNNINEFVFSLHNKIYFLHLLFTVFMKIFFILMITEKSFLTLIQLGQNRKNH